MQGVTPQIYVVAETNIIDDQMDKFLIDIGAKEWTTDAHSECEELVEIGGRLCYKAFGTDLNKNLTRVRNGNAAYIKNIIEQEHGSVIEHATTTVIMRNVSRILTHEYVRHRQGTAFSQESMRFVRLDDIPMWIPDIQKDFDALANIVLKDRSGTIPVHARTMFTTYAKSMMDVTQLAERRIREIAEYLDYPGVPFSLKKKITSALRRMAPGGHATNIMGTGNHRAWRFQIQQRTSPGAEDEIRMVFGMIAEEFVKRYPAFYQDMRSEPVDGYNSYTFEHHKI